MTGFHISEEDCDLASAALRHACEYAKDRASERTGQRRKIWRDIQWTADRLATAIERRHEKEEHLAYDDNPERINDF